MTYASSEPPRDPLRAPRARLGSSWQPFRTVWGRLCVRLARLGRFLGQFGASLVLSGSPAETRSGRLGTFGKRRGPLEGGLLGAIFGASGTTLSTPAAETERPEESQLLFLPPRSL